MVVTKTAETGISRKKNCSTNNVNLPIHGEAKIRCVPTIKKKNPH